MDRKGAWLPDPGRGVVLRRDEAVEPPRLRGVLRSAQPLDEHVREVALRSSVALRRGELPRFGDAPR